MPLDDKAINASLRSIFRIALGMPANSVRPANQNAPTGDLSTTFGTVLVTEIDTQGVDQRTYADQGVEGQLLEIISGIRRVMVSFQSFRTGAYSDCLRLGGLLRGSASLRALNLAGITLIRVGRATNITQVIDTLDEERAQVELEFSVSSVEQSAVATLASVDITVTVDNKSKTIEVNLDVDS